MQCPVCTNVALDVRHSHGIEVDVCPDCGGVWLNRGELDKLITQARTEPQLATYEAPKKPTTSTEERVPSGPGRREQEEDDDREEWKSDRRSHNRRADDRRSRKPKKSKVRSWGDRLEYVLDDVLDLDDIFDL